MQARLSCADSSFPKLTHEAALAVVRGLGIGAVDICSFTGYDHTPPATVLADPARAAEVVKERVERHELEVADVFFILGTSFEELAPNHPDPDVRARSFEHFTTLVDFAQRVAPPGITILPGTAFPDVDEEESLELAAAELNRRAKVAGEAGLELNFEPHYGSLAETPERALALIERTPHVGFTLDYSHFVYQDIPQDDVDRLLPRTRHFHVRQAAPKVIQARAHEGTIDFERIRDALLGMGYTGYFGLEYQWEDGWLDFTRVDCISESAELRDVLLRTPDADGGSR